MSLNSPPYIWRQLLSKPDNSNDIGSSGNNRPRNIYIAGFSSLAEITTPAIPAGGELRFYPKSDHNLYILDSTGLETLIGAQGPAGPQGPQGIQGAPGASNATYSTEYNWSTQIGGAPGNGNVRGNTATPSTTTQFSFANVTALGVDDSQYLAALDVGNGVYMQVKANSAVWGKWDVTGPSVAMGNYYNVPVSWIEGAGTEPNNNADLSVSFTSEGLTGIPPGGTTGQALAKQSDNDYDVYWIDVATPADIANLQAQIDSLQQQINDLQIQIGGKAPQSSVDVISSDHADLTKTVASIVNSLPATWHIQPLSRRY